MAIEQEVTLDEEGNEVVEPQTEERDDDENEEHPSLESSDDGEESGTDEEREAIRARRREERRHRKENQREREDTLRRELAARDSIINEMRGRLDVVERRNSGSELAQIENAKKQTAQAYNYFKDQIRLGTEAANGAAVADATEKMLQAQRKFDEITAIERNIKQRQSTPQPLDPRMVNHAQEWMSRNTWYDPSGRDADSRIALTVDQAMAEEGWNPSTKEYWQELESRVKKYIPHRANRGIINSERPRSVVTGSGREGGSGSGGGSATYTLSAERVNALKEAGMWNDPKQRAEAIKRFR